MRSSRNLRTLRRDAIERKHADPSRVECAQCVTPLVCRRDGGCRLALPAEEDDEGVIDWFDLRDGGAVDMREPSAQA